MKQTHTFIIMLALSMTLPQETYANDATRVYDSNTECVSSHMIVNNNKYSCSKYPRELFRKRAFFIPDDKIQPNDIALSYHRSQINGDKKELARITSENKYEKLRLLTISNSNGKSIFYYCIWKAKENSTKYQLGVLKIKHDKDNYITYYTENSEKRYAYLTDDKNDNPVKEVHILEYEKAIEIIMNKTFDELVDLLTAVIEKSASIDDDKVFEDVKNAIDAAVAVLNKAEDADEEDEEALLQEFSHAVHKAAELAE